MKFAQELLRLNVTDYIIIAVVAISMLISLVRGVFKEIISLVMWVVGFLLAMKFYTVLAAMLTPYINNVSARLIIGFAGIFLSVLVFGTLFGYLLSLIIVKTGLGGFDRLLGMIFGGARGVLLVSVVLLLISTTAFIQDDWWRKSVLIPHLKILIDWLRVCLPQKITHFVGMVN